MDALSMVSVSFSAVEQAVGAKWKMEEPSAGSDRMKIEEAGMSDRAVRQMRFQTQAWVDTDGWEKKFKMSVTRCRRNM